MDTLCKGWVLFLCLTSCTSERILQMTVGNSTRNFHLLHVGGGVTWSMARDMCSGDIQGSRLAVLNTPGVADAVQRALQVNKWFWSVEQSRAEALVWLGARRNTSMDQWRLLGSTDPVSTDVISVRSEGRCLSRSLQRVDSHAFFQRSCLGQMGQFLCTLPPEACAPHKQDATHVTMLPSNRCLVVCTSVTKEYTWFEARNYCVLQGGDLAGAEAEEWTDYEHSGGLWVGGLKQRWEWADGKDVTYTRWLPHQPLSSPGSDCAALTVDGWVSMDCSQALNNVLCEEIVIDVTSATTETLTSTPEVSTVRSTPGNTTITRQQLTPQSLDEDSAGKQHITVNNSVFHHHDYTPVVAGVCGFLAGVLFTLLIHCAVRKLSKRKPTQESTPQAPIPVLSFTAIRNLDASTYSAGHYGNQPTLGASSAVSLRDDDLPHTKF